MKKQSKILLSLLAVSSLANADFVSFGLGVDKLSPSMDGSVSQGNNLLEISKAESPSDASTLDNARLWADLKHPIPVVPNIRIEKTKYNIASDKTQAKDFVFNFGGTDYSWSGETRQMTTSELDMVDFTPYYNLLDETFWLSLNVGVTIRQLQGDFTYNVIQYDPVFGDNTVSGEEKIEKMYLPLGYVNAKVNIPNTNLAVEGTYRGVAYQENSLHEFRAGVEYESGFGLGARAGYEQMTLKTNELNSFDTELTLKSLYAGVFYRF